MRGIRVALSLVGPAGWGLCQEGALGPWGTHSLWTLVSSPEELAFWPAILRSFPVLEICVHVSTLNGGQSGDGFSRSKTVYWFSILILLFLKHLHCPRKPFTCSVVHCVEP